MVENYIFPPLNIADPFEPIGASTKIADFSVKGKVTNILEPVQLPKINPSELAGPKPHVPHKKNNIILYSILGAVVIIGGYYAYKKYKERIQEE